MTLKIGGGIEYLKVGKHRSIKPAVSRDELVRPNLGVSANNKVGQNPVSPASLLPVYPAGKEQRLAVRGFNPNHVVSEEVIAVFSRCELRTDFRIDDIADHQQPFRRGAFNRSQA